RRNHQAAGATKETLPCKSRRQHEGKDAMRILRGPIHAKPKVLEFANFQRFSATLAANPL
ncbi:MAG TPA: hypothetical protein VFH28_09025, partial [Nitrososphaera sp.]|nr:hypothetical protein [Nitrososphaera sp.]